MFSNLFNVKAKNTNAVYNKIISLYGNVPQYTKTNYYSVAKEGYSENHVMFRCIREIINAATQVEWIVYNKQKNGKVKDVPGHPAISTLNKPNPINSKESFIERIIAYYYIAGDVPIHKIQTIKSTSLFAYRPDKVSFHLTGDMDMPYKDIKYNTTLDIEPENFNLFKSFDPLDEYDGLGRGMSQCAPAFKSGDLLNAFLDWNVSLLQNGGRPSGAFVTESALDEDSYERAKAQLKNEHAGSQKVGKLLLLEGGLKYQQIGENPKDMDWKEGKESSIIDICAAFGVDPILVGYNKYSTYNNKKEAKKGLYTSVVMPLMSKLAGFLTEFLKLDDGYYISADFSHVPVMQEDEAEKTKRINESKFMTINEKRQALGYDSIEGCDIIGDVIVIEGIPYIAMNLVQAGEELQPKKQVEEIPKEL